MSINFLFPITLLTLLHWHSGIYSIRVVSVRGDTLELESFAKKKILVTAFSASDPEIGLLKRLDSLQRSFSSLQVIAVPGNDLGGEGSDSTLASLQDSLSLNILLLRSALVKKDAQENQHPLFKWLTDANANIHFAMDVDSPGQLFVVSETGILYSVLSPGVQAEMLNGILSQTVEE